MGKTHSGSVAEIVKKNSIYPHGNEGPENTDSRATATCFCGTVQLSFVSPAPLIKLDKRNERIYNSKSKPQNEETVH